MSVNVAYHRRMRTVLDLADACCVAGTHLLDARPAEALASVFKALADPTRVRLLDHIAAAPEGTACACHLPDALGISQPTLSHHLRKLVEAGLITREQRGRWAHYTVVPDAVASVRAFLAGLSDPAPRGADNGGLSRAAL